MTVTTTHNRIAYVGDGSTTVFPYTFLIIDSSEIFVYVDDELQLSGYSVSGVNEAAGGNITFTTAPDDQASIVLHRDTDIVQTIDILEGSRLPAAQHEGMFDRLTVICQDLDEHIGRAITVPVTSDSADLEFPDPSDPANQDKAIFINGSGELETRTILSTDIASPITAKGDLIQGADDGTPEALAIGLTGQLLTVVSGKASWEDAPADSVPLSIIDAKGDLIVGTAADTAARKAVGADGTALVADSTQSDGLRWSTVGGTHVDLLLESATPPNNTAGNIPPETVREVSSGTLTNAPSPTSTYMKFDASTDEVVMWSRMCPPNWGSGFTVRGKWKAATATSGNVMWKAGLAVLTDGSTDDDAVAFIAVDLSSASAAPSTQGQLKEFTITVTTTGLAANKQYRLFLGRDADNASDTMTGDAILTAVRWEYTPA